MKLLKHALRIFMLGALGFFNIHVARPATAPCERKMASPKDASDETYNLSASYLALLTQQIDRGAFSASQIDKLIEKDLQPNPTDLLGDQSSAAEKYVMRYAFGQIIKAFTPFTKNEIKSRLKILALAQRERETLRVDAQRQTKFVNAPVFLERLSSTPPINEMPYLMDAFRTKAGHLWGLYVTPDTEGSSVLGLLDFENDTNIRLAREVLGPIRWVDTPGGGILFSFKSNFKYLTVWELTPQNVLVPRNSDIIFDNTPFTIYPFSNERENGVWAWDASKFVKVSWNSGPFKEIKRKKNKIPFWKTREYVVSPKGELLLFTWNAITKKVTGTNVETGASFYTGPLDRPKMLKQETQVLDEPILADLLQQTTFAFSSGFSKADLPLRIPSGEAPEQVYCFGRPIQTHPVYDNTNGYIEYIQFKNPLLNSEKESFYYIMNYAFKSLLLLHETPRGTIEGFFKDARDGIQAVQFYGPIPPRGI